MVIKGADLEVAPSDYLTWFFERQLLPSRETDELFIDADNPEDVITRGEAKEYAQRIGYALRNEENIGADGPGRDVITMFSSNQMMYPIAMLGTLCAGGIWSPTPYNLGAAELARHLDITQPKLVFCSENLLGTVREACEIAGIAPSKIYKVASSPRTITNVETGKSLIGKSKLEWDRSTDAEFLKETVILLHFTSGTTGLPKAVAFSHYSTTRNFESRFFQIHSSKDGRMKEHVPNDKMRPIGLGQLPLSHGSGTHIVSMAGGAGGRVYIVNKFDVNKFGNYFVNYPLSSFGGLPHIIRLIVQGNLSQEVWKRISQVESISVGGAPFPRSLEDDLNAKLDQAAGSKRVARIGQAWGMTECGWGFGWASDDTEIVQGAIGRLMPNMAAKIVDEEGKELGPEEVGELVLTNGLAIKQYWRNPQATQLALRDGWFYTGDLMKYSKDGIFWYLDRKKVSTFSYRADAKELLKYDGYQIAPAEVEMVLDSHPKINEVAVVGIPQLGREENDIPLALVVRRSKDLTEQEVKDYVLANMAEFKQLRGGVLFVDSIPKNPMGKLSRPQLREMALQLLKQQQNGKH